MSDYCVVLVNGARARFFTLEPAASPEVEGGPNLVEQQDLVNVEEDAHNGELWSNTKSGRHHAPGGGQAHGYDDHRQQHSEEFRRRFARSIAQAAIQLVQRTDSKEVILATEKKMLGLLRTELNSLAKSGVQLRTIRKDISKFSVQEVHEYLAKENLVPRRRPPAA